MAIILKQWEKRARLDESDKTRIGDCVTHLILTCTIDPLELCCDRLYSIRSCNVLQRISLCDRAVSNQLS